MQNNDHIIAILGGTGKEGQALALRWASAGYKIIIGSRQEDKAKIVANELNERLGEKLVTGLVNTEAAQLAEICVLTVTQTAHQQLLESLKYVLKNKILVDATARVDFKNPQPPEPPSAAQHAQNLLDPSVKVVAAFQTIPARLLSERLGESIDADVLVCSDDLLAAERVISLAEQAGLRAYYAGKLVNSIVVEGITSILISLNKHYKVKDASIRVAGITV